MAVLNIIQKNSYSIVDNIIINKEYKNLYFDLVTYEDNSKSKILDSKSYNINANTVCKEVYLHILELNEADQLIEKLKKNIKDIITFIKENNEESYDLNSTDPNQQIYAILQYLNYYGAYKVNIHNISIENPDDVVIDYEEDKSFSSYYSTLQKNYYYYSEDKKEFKVDSKVGINTDHFFNNNILPAIRVETDILKMCYSLAKVIDPDLFYETIDV
jgi:hypothetical protein